MGFKSCESYDLFVREVTCGNRYIHSDDVKDFLKNVLATSSNHEASVDSGTKLWRAQLGCDWDSKYHEDKGVRGEPVPFPPERMKPIQFESPEGRVNPKGIPCLYLANKEETAMAEVRPSLNAYISVGKFKTARVLRLANCTGLPSHGSDLYRQDHDDLEKEGAVWADIDRAFSRPVTPSDESSDYVPTQIIAELFRSEGYDGVAYGSALSRGLNLALFDIADATMLNCLLSSVEKIQLSFKQSSNVGYSLWSDSDG